MIYKFIDDKGTFTVENSQKYSLYFPLTNKDGSLLSSISPNLAGDIKKDSDHFLTVPASIEDIRSNLLCRRDFFIKVDKETTRLSYPYNDSLECGFLYQKVIKNAGLLDIEIINFIPYNLSVEIMWIKVKNKSNKEIKITPTSLMPLYARAEKNLRDHRHVSSLLNHIDLNKYGILLKPTMVFDEQGHKENKMIYFVLGYENKTKPPVGQFPTLDYFCGEGDLISPDAIMKNKKPATKKVPEFDGKESCAAFRFADKKLKPFEETHYLLILGIDDNKQKIKNTFYKLNSLKKVKKSFEETKKYWLDYLSGLDFDFKNRDFNNWLLWVRLQPTLRKLFGCSFLPHFDYGKGGRGWRDLWQDALTLLTTEPNKAKELILKSFAGVRMDGSNATIIAKDGNFIADRNKISRVWMDHGVWPYLALRAYIHKSADLEILLKEIVYFKDHQVKRAKETDKEFFQSDYFLHTKNNNIYKGSILEHVLIQNLIQFFNVGNHNIIKLENADWNDGLDMASDKGESVTFSFMYAYNLKDLCFFLEALKKRNKNIFLLKELTILLDKLNEPLNYDNFREKQKRLQEYFEKTKNIGGEKVKVEIDDLIFDLKEKSTHLSAWLSKKEWLKQGFFNGYYDNMTRRVEGKTEGRIKMLLPSQVFAIMSDVATDTQIKKIWLSISKYLKDKRFGGFRLNTDFGSIYLELGRAFGFSYGDKENGAFFNHMVVMLAYSLYKRGFIKEGFEAMNSIYKMATDSCAKIYPGIPEYFNNEGRGLYLYLTGSASWYTYTLLEQILGIKFILGNLYIEPKLLAHNFFKQTIEIKFNYQNKLIKLYFVKETNKSTPYQIKKLHIESKEITKQNNAYLVKKEIIKRINKKEITITIALH
ncbi:MAG: cellobiose phosphorylase [Candidatus Omnitrophota bacterium]|nr:cellobiose phosphorylase [Candidatus Omnitrophota bacterium]